MREILIARGGYAGFRTARALRERLRRTRVLPEVSDRPGAWVVRHERGLLPVGADPRGRPVRDHRHSSLGVVASPGPGRGIFQYRGIAIKGFPAWLMHRGYHVPAVPGRERKIRVLAVRLTAALTGRDLVSLASVWHPREAFVTGGRARGQGVDRTKEGSTA